MSNCDIHKRKPYKGGKMITFSNCYKSMSMPSCKKFNRQTVKKSTNQHNLCNIEQHRSSEANNSCEKNFENLNNGHVCSNLHEPVNSEPCKVHNIKNNKCCAVNNHQLHDKETSKCCLTDQNHCTNGIDNSDKATELKPLVAETVQCENDITEKADSRYCQYHTNSRKNTKFKSSMPHTDCKYCHTNVDKDEGVSKSKRSIPHTDCKYCQNNINTKQQTKPNVPLYHTDCKYCLNNLHNRVEVTSETSSVSNESVCCSDELFSLHQKFGDGHVPCLVHDRDVILDPLPLSNPYCQMHHRRPMPDTCRICDYPELCLVNNHSSYIRECLTDQYLPSIRELNIQNDTNESRKFKPCEFCLRNGENPVIYNSHQFRNIFGTITCPIVRKNISHGYEINGKFANCLCNYDETTAAINSIHPYTTMSHMEMPFKETFHGCGSSSLPLQSISSGDLYSPPSSLEIPCPYGFEPKPNLQENRRFRSNFNEYFYSTDKHHDIQPVSNDYLNVPTFNQYDTAIPFPKYRQNCNTSKLSQTSNSANIRKSKKGVDCQFCLTTGKPPYIYNSHALRDDNGVKCPILKEHVNRTTGHNCSRVSHNIFDCEICFPLVKGIANGSLGKRQYFNLTDCLG